MAAFLLIWNPKGDPRRDLQELSKIVKVQQYHATTWGVGNTKQIQLGDRVFIIRLVQEPKGIFASGEVISDIYERTHRDAAKRAADQPSRSIDIRLDALLDPEHDEILDLEWLGANASDTFYWTPQRSGNSIPNDIAAKLKEALAHRMNT